MTKEVGLKGKFNGFNDPKKTTSLGRKKFEGEDKTEQHSFRTKVTTWRKFLLLVSKIERKALESGEGKPTQGDVFEMAIELLDNKYK